MRLEIRKQIYGADVVGQRYISLTWPIKPFSWCRSKVIIRTHRTTLYGGYNGKKCNCKACPKCAESCLPENEVECDDLLQAGVNFFRSARLVNAAKLYLPCLRRFTFPAGFYSRNYYHSRRRRDIPWRLFSLKRDVFTAVESAPEALS